LPYQGVEARPARPMSSPILRNYAGRQNGLANRHAAFAGSSRKEMMLGKVKEVFAELKTKFR
jgi:hypothetical protein